MAWVGRDLKDHEPPTSQAGGVNVIYSIHSILLALCSA